MNALPGYIPGFLLVLLGFGFLIFIHELGHFLAAKWAGIRADGFAIGMGPCVVSYRRGIGLVLGSADHVAVRRFGRRPIEMSDRERIANGLGETEYSLRVLPLGGYVRMLGQEDGNPGATSQDARSFTKAPIGRRAVVILAGIAANLALALVLFLIAFLSGVRFPAPRIGYIVPGSPAARAEPLLPSAGVGLQPGDRILGIDGATIHTFADLRVAAAMAKPDAALLFELARGDETLGYKITPERDARSGLLSIGVDPARGATITDVRGSLDEVNRALDSTADAAGKSLLELGVVPGSRVEKVDGRSVGTYAELDLAAEASAGRAMMVDWRAPDGTTLRTELAPEPSFEPLQPDAEGAVADLGLLGFVPLARVREVVAESPNRDTLRAGDIFLRAGSAEGPRSSELLRVFRAKPGARIPVLVLRDGVETALEVETDREGRVGVYLEPAFDSPRLARSIDRVMTRDGARDTAAKALAVVPRGTLRALDGKSIRDFRDLRAQLVARANAMSRPQDASNDSPPATTDQATAAGDGSVGERSEVAAGFSIELEILDPSPQATPTTTTIVLGAEDIASLRRLGERFPVPDAYFDPEFTVLSADGNPLKAIAMGFRQTVTMIEQVFLTLDRVGRGSVGVEQLQGPVGILHTGTQVADEGFMYLVFFLALISVNLAVVNALPIPIADGGLFLFLMYEKFRGRPPSIAFQNAAALAGIALVLGLFLLTFYNDLGRLFG